MSVDSVILSIWFKFTLGLEIDRKSFSAGRLTQLFHIYFFVASTALAVDYVNKLKNETFMTFLFINFLL